MKYLLTVLAMIAFILGFIIFKDAKGAIHEIAGLITILIGAVFFTGSVIVETIQRYR